MLILLNSLKLVNPLSKMAVNCSLECISPSISKRQTSLIKLRIAGFALLSNFFCQKSPKAAKFGVFSPSEVNSSKRTIEPSTRTKFCVSKLEATPTLAKGCHN